MPCNRHPSSLLAASLLALLAVPAFAGEESSRASGGPAAAVPVRPLALESRESGGAESFPLLGRGDGYAVFVGGSGAVWSPARSDRAGLTLRFAGAREDAVAVAADPLPGRVLDLTAPRGDRRDLSRATFGRALVAGLYPGVDLVWRTDGGDLGYDLHLAPGADAGAVAMEFGAAGALEVDPSGDLVVRVAGGAVRHSAPVAWMEDGDARRPVRASFDLRAGNRVGFRIEGRDARLPLVIDPVVRFSSYLGGSGTDRVRAVAAGAGGTVFLAGVTASSNFPVKSALQTSAGGGTDAFITKIAADGRTVLFSTYLGGSGDDDALAAAADGSGGVWVAGTTASSNFPVQGAYQAQKAGAEDGFVAHLSGDGSTLISSTYLGGSAKDGIAGIATDSSGNAWVAGSTASGNFPIDVLAFQVTFGGGTDAFVASFSGDGGTLRSSSYFGGEGDDEALALAADAAGRVTVVGRTASDSFPTVAPLYSTLSGTTDAFVLGIDASTAGVLFSTYLGGSDSDEARAVTSNGQGVLLVGGMTGSSDFPVAGAFQSALSGGADAFVTTMASDGASLLWSTFLGGSGSEGADAVALDASGDALVAGSTDSSNFPLVAAAQTSNGGGTDGFVSRLSGSGSSLVYSTYFGGSGSDAIGALCAVTAGEVVAAGATDSTNLGTVVPFQGSSGGGTDGFVARIPTTPPTPDNMGASGVTYLHVLLTWEDPSNGRGTFEVQRKSLPGDWVTLAVLPAGTTSWTDTTVVPGTLYSYRIRCLLDGMASPFSSDLAVQTPNVPLPVVPGDPVLVAESPRRIRVTWVDRSDDEVTFEVFRSVDGGSYGLAGSLTSGNVEWVDEGVTPDRTWSYLVRAVGITGPSPFSGAAWTTTDATLGLEVLSGKRVDVARAARDSVSLTARITLPEGGAALDPAAGGIEIGIGDDGSAPILAIPAGDGGWKVRKGIYTWKSPKGSVSRASVVVDTVRGTVKFKASKVDLSGADASSVRVRIRCGAEAGSFRSEWVERKAGYLLAK